MKEYLSEIIGNIIFGGIALLFIILLTDIIGGFIGYFGRIIIDKWKTKKKQLIEEIEK